MIPYPPRMAGCEACRSFSTVMTPRSSRELLVRVFIPAAGGPAERKQALEDCERRHSSALTEVRRDLHGAETFLRAGSRVALAPGLSDPLVSIELEID